MTFKRLNRIINRRRVNSIQRVIKKRMIKAHDDFKNIIKSTDESFQASIMKSVINIKTDNLNSQKSSNYIIHYNSQFRIKFDLLIVLLALFTCFKIPLELSFGEELMFTEQGRFYLHLIDHIIDFIFFIDIILNFFTSFINS